MNKDIWIIMAIAGAAALIYAYRIKQIQGSTVTYTRTHNIPLDRWQIDALEKMMEEHGS